MKEIIGNAKIITFRTHRGDSAFVSPLSAMAKGISTGHAALVLTFSDQELYNNYIANNNKIPHTIKMDPVTKQAYYEVYVSFWPQESSGLASKPSKFVDYEFDVENSALYSPFEYDERWINNNFCDETPSFAISLDSISELISPLALDAKELKRIRDLIQKSRQKAPVTLSPLEISSAPVLPLLKYLLKTKFKLGPMILVHTTRIEHAFGSEVAKAMQKYAKQYTEWREMVVATHNTANTGNVFEALYRQLAIIYKGRLQDTEQYLKGLMFSDPNLTHSEFIARLEPYVTFGNPEKDAYSIPIVKNFTKTQPLALELEPMLEYIVTIANNPNEHLYNVLKLNCAAITYNTLWSGAKNSPHSQLRQLLALAWYVNVFRLTLTPTMIIQNAANNADEIKGSAIQFRSSESSAGLNASNFLDIDEICSLGLSK